MTALTKGANAAVPTAPLRAVVRWRPGPVSVDASALLLTAAGRVRDDADMVFYNAPRHASGAVRHVADGAGPQSQVLEVDLPSLPGGVERVVVAASADGGTFAQVAGLTLAVLDQAGTELVSYAVEGLSTETALVVGELYLRGGAWKARAVGQGWASGLAGLATDFGITVDDEPAAPAVSLKKQKQVDLEKRAAATAPQLVSLVKTAAVSLEKRGLGEHTARVALCLDISASMSRLYSTGKVQQLCERVLALALRFDDDGQVDVFLFGKDGHQAGSLDLESVAGFTAPLARRLEGATYYDKAMRLVRRHYFGSDAPRSRPLSDPVPVYVMFVTDGMTSNEGDVEDQVRSSSYEPIFWQFMAIGRSSRGRTQTSRLVKGTSEFRFLEQLDDMPGRLVDNADFFSVEDPVAVPDEELYDLLMTEYPGWLTAARSHGLLT